MKIKFNWGHGILLTFILFMTSVLIQVFFYMNTNVDLVTEGYYEKEMKYEDHLVSINNTAALEQNISVDYTGSDISIKFPPGYKNDNIEGTILFYRPSDPSKDLLINLRPDNNSVHKVDIKEIASGYWKIKINWAYRDKSYYYEKSLLIN